jgi:tetratricopeptide (TPR) repeat protein
LFSKAEEVITAAIEKRRRGTFYESRAQFKMIQKKHEEALADIKIALTLEPANVLIHRQAAEILCSMNKWEEAYYR